MKEKRRQRECERERERERERETGKVGEKKRQNKKYIRKEIILKSFLSQAQRERGLPAE